MAIDIYLNGSRFGDPSTPFRLLRLLFNVLPPLTAIRGLPGGVLVPAIVSSTFEGA